MNKGKVADLKKRGGNNMQGELTTNHECSCKSNVSQSFTFKAGALVIKDLGLELKDIEVSFSVGGIPADTYSKLVDMLYQYFNIVKEGYDA